MEEIKRLINTELDPEFYDRIKEAKQQRGFIPEGKKIMEYIAHNAVMVHDINSGAEYLIDYLGLFNIIEVMGFSPKKLEIAKSKLFNNKSIIVDFDSKKIMIYHKEEKLNIIGEYLTSGKEEYDNLLKD